MPEAEAWSPWSPFDRALGALADREVSAHEERAFVDTLAHLGLIQIRREQDGRRSFRMRMDAPERMRESLELLRLWSEAAEQNRRVSDGQRPGPRHLD